MGLFVVTPSEGAGLKAVDVYTRKEHGYPDNHELAVACNLFSISCRMTSFGGLLTTPELAGMASSGQSEL